MILPGWGLFSFPGIFYYFSFSQESSDMSLVDYADDEDEVRTLGPQETWSSTAAVFSFPNRDQILEAEPASLKLLHSAS